MFEFPSDTSLPNEEIEVNRLDNQALLDITKPNGGDLNEDQHEQTRNFTNNFILFCVCSCLFVAKIL